MFGRLLTELAHTALTYMIYIRERWYSKDMDGCDQSKANVDIFYIHVYVYILRAFYISLEQSSRYRQS